MQFIPSLSAFSACPALQHGIALSIGNFDGVHLGHQHILARLKAQAARLNVPSVVMLFEPQPKEFFMGENAPARLMRLRDKLHALAAAQIDFVIGLRFNAAFAAQSPEQFIQSLLVEKLGVRYLSVGDDFRFGAKRAGDFNTLCLAGERFGFEVENSHSHRLNDARISSSLIREALSRGDFSLAAQLLGKPYAIRGKVVHGQALGRTIGFPTANIPLQRQVVPLQGVYAVELHCEGQRWNAIANIGKRPTVNGTRALLEVHLFDFAQDLYRKEVEVVFLEKVRDEIKFPDIQALKAQIAQDVAQVKAYFAAR